MFTFININVYINFKFNNCLKYICLYNLLIFMLFHLKFYLRNLNLNLNSLEINQTGERKELKNHQKTNKTI